MEAEEFWELIGRLDWEHEGDDAAVLEPVVSSLAAMSDERIFAFDDALALRLHETGFIRECFGRDLPVIIHELEYYEAIYDQNVRANGEEVSWDFVSYWINGDAPYGETPVRFQKYLK